MITDIFSFVYDKIIQVEIVNCINFGATGDDLKSYSIFKFKATKPIIIESEFINTDVIFTFTMTRMHDGIAYYNGFLYRQLDLFVA